MGSGRKTLGEGRKRKKLIKKRCLEMEKKGILLRTIYKLVYKGE